MNFTFTKSSSFSKFMSFVLPSILSMVCLSFYSGVDSYYMAHYVSTDALAAINLVIPYTNFIWGLTIMLASGSSSLIGILLGRQQQKKANQAFTLIFIFLLALSSLFSFISILNIKSLLAAMGANDTLFHDAYIYLLVLTISNPILTTKLFMEYYVRLDGRPRVALAMSCIGLVLNVVFDHLTIAILGWGVWGASISTVISILISSLIGLLYFQRHALTLHFCKPVWDPSFIGRSLLNGASELLTEISSGIVGILFNVTMLRYAGDNGVAALAVVINLYYFLISFYIGIAAGIQPLISYNFGSHNLRALTKLLRYANLAIVGCSIAIFVFAQLFGGHIISWYIGSNQAVIALAQNGFKLFSICFLFLGLNVLIAGLYTSVGSGRIAAILTSCRCLFFVLIAVNVLPHFIGLEGIWYTIPVAEGLALVFSLGLYSLFFKHYIFKH